MCGRDGRTICGPLCVPKSTDAVSACREIHVCHCNSLGGATCVTITGRTADGQTDGRTDRVWRNMRPPRTEEGRLITIRSSRIIFYLFTHCAVKYRRYDSVFKFVMADFCFVYIYFSKVVFYSRRLLNGWSERSVYFYWWWIGQALNPARPTSLKTVPARPKIRPGQEDVKSRRRLIKGDRRWLLRNYVVVRRRGEHAPSNPATKVNDGCRSWGWLSWPHENTIIIASDRG